LSRPPVFTRIATEDDLATMLVLANELGEVGGRAERAVNPLTIVDARERILAVMVDPWCRVVVALGGDVPVGMVIMRVNMPDPLSEGQVVDITNLVVSRACRHHGVGHALMAAAADFASERHIDHVAVSIYPSLRDTIRFLARLGFAPMAVRRIAPVSVLRRRLGVEAGAQSGTNAVRRRARILRPVPPQSVRRGSTERVDS
jgi:GNAT superfamily N-acetyltransferase